MTLRVTRPRASASEVATVFAIVLGAAMVVAHVRLRVLGDGHDLTSSYLLIAAAASLAFWFMRAVGQPVVAWAITSLLLLILACSALAAISSKRLDPFGVVPRIPTALPPIPMGLVQIADWLTDRPPTWIVHERAIMFGPEARIVVDGTPEASDSYLAVSNPEYLERDTYLVVEGVVRTGGLSVGLQKAGRWATYVTVTRSGPFRRWVVVPSDDDFQLVLAYAAVAHTRTHVELAPLTLWR